MVLSNKTRKLKVAIISSNPNFLGGVSLYQKNLISFLKNKHKIFWIYAGSKDKKYVKEGIHFIELNVPKTTLLENLVFEFKVYMFFKKNKFDIINSQGFSGFWLNFYKKSKNERIIHTYHGSTFFFYKNHLRRFNYLKKILFSPLLLISYIMEKSSWKKADKIICVSEHVKKELEKLYGKRNGVSLIRTGVDINIFRPRDKKISRKRLNLDQNKKYGLYVGRGGYWTKGLDKVIEISEEIYRLDKNYKLIVIGADPKKVNHLIKKDFIILLPPQSREKMPHYYNSSDFFFSMSRYEGGAPTMVTSEAMASGCLIITDKEANQEVFENRINGIVLTKNYGEEAKKILATFKDTKNKNKLIMNSINFIKTLSLEKWGKKYLKVIFYQYEHKI